MNQRYTYLTVGEQYQIKAYKKAGFSKREIALELKRHHACKPKSIKLTPSLKCLIINRLRKDWSSEQKNKVTLTKSNLLDLMILLWHRI